MPQYESSLHFEYYINIQLDKNDTAMYAILDIERTTINLHEVIVLIKNFYQGIQRETSKCRKGKVKELPIWKDFKDACQEDMQVKTKFFYSSGKP